MRFYLAATYARRQEMKTIMIEIARMGHEVTSRWITDDYDEDDTERMAMDDLIDIQMSDILVVFNDPEGVPSTSRGGRHVEFGYALGKHKAILVVGPKSNPFYTLPQLTHVDTTEEFLDHLKRYSYYQGDDHDVTTD